MAQICKSIKRTRGDLAFDIINVILVLFIALIVLYPMWFTVIASFSEPYLVQKGEVIWLWKGFNIASYKNVFENKQIWTGYRNTIFYTIISTIMHIGITIPAAYAMSRKALKGKGLLNAYFIITMYFSGGLIPYYLLIRDLHMINTIWVFILPAAFSVYNMIVARTFYSSNFPDEIYEAAKIDGANEFSIFIKFAFPLSGSIIAVIGLWSAVGVWNTYMPALLYVDNPNLYPLQMVLRNILLFNERLNVITMDGYSEEFINLYMSQAIQRTTVAMTMKYSLIIISSVPMLIAYPFVQKYFVKGVMVGSLKG